MVLLTSISSKKLKSCKDVKLRVGLFRIYLQPFPLYPRKCKVDARAAIKAWSPGTPAPPTRAKSADPQLTPGEMYERESQFSDDESDVDPADVKEVEPLTFRLMSNWKEATKSEKMLCKEKVDEAC